MHMGTADNNATNGYPYPKSETLYTTQQAADILKVSVRTVFNHRNMGLLNFIQACDKSPVYFTEEQLNEYRQRISRKNGGG